MEFRKMITFGAGALLSVSILAAQAPTGMIHGRVTDPTGVPKTEGTESLSTDGGKTLKYSFPLDANGDYKGSGIAPGTYTLVLRLKDTAEGKIVDHIDNVKIVAGQDTQADDDLSRKEYIDAMTPEQKKQVEEFKKKNADVMKSNLVIKNLNADLGQVKQLLKEGDAAHATAVSTLGANASKSDIQAKETEIKLAKYGEAETMMLKDTAAKPDAAILWTELGNAQSGLGKYDDAETSFKKAETLNNASGKPNLDIEGAIQSGLGTVYAKNKKIDEANAAFDAAAKAVPAQAGVYYSNYAKILYTMNSSGSLGNPDAQAAAADKAIAATPNGTGPAYALLFYLKAQALTQKATFDEKTQKITLPAGATEAYQKYLDLDPNGIFAEDSKGVLAAAGQKIENKYKAKK
jgi:tetratricopeptide (TPR) repeat protein